MRGYSCEGTSYWRSQQQQQKSRWGGGSRCSIEQQLTRSKQRQPRQETVGDRDEEGEAAAGHEEPAAAQVDVEESYSRNFPFVMR